MLKCFKSLWLLVVSIVLLSACNTKTLEPQVAAVGYDFYPLEVGLYQIYKVEDVRRPVVGPIVNLNYLLKEVIVDTFSSGERTKNWRIERYTFPDTSASLANQSQLNWQLDSVWYVYQTPNAVVKVENNIAFTKLIFPVREGTTWNGNQYNNRFPDAQERWRVSEFDRQVRLGRLNFPRALLVTQKNEASRIGLELRTERFARNIGLIQKVMNTEVYAQDTCRQGNCPTVVVEARNFRQTILSYGKE